MLLETTQFLHGKEDILDLIYATRIGCRFHAAALVGAGSNNSNRVSELVDRLPQPLVLNQEERLLFFVIPIEVKDLLLQYKDGWPSGRVFQRRCTHSHWSGYCRT